MKKPAAMLALAAGGINIGAPGVAGGGDKAFTLGISHFF